MLLVGNARFVVYDVQTAMNDNDSDPEQENATHNIAEGGKATTGAGSKRQRKAIPRMSVTRPNTSTTYPNGFLVDLVVIVRWNG